MFTPDICFMTATEQSSSHKTEAIAAVTNVLPTPVPVPLIKIFLSSLLMSKVSELLNSH